jgi:hypothetical protein
VYLQMKAVPEIGQGDAYDAIVIQQGRVARDWLDPGRGVDGNQGREPRNGWRDTQVCCQFFL